MTDDKLKPCPFCGSANIDAKGWSSQNSSGPACDDCGASAGSTLADTPEANIAAWSARATDTQVSSLVSALESVRACRLPAQKGVRTIHGVVDMEAAWNVSGLTKLLPEIDAALDGIVSKSA